MNAEKSEVLSMILRIFHFSKKNQMKYTVAIICLALVLLTGSLTAQEETTSELFLSLKANDSLIFTEGFNRCNLEPLDDLMASDLEFYHDKGGMQDKALFLKLLKENICSSPNRKPIRKLTPNTLKVFPLYTNEGKLYGAIQEGKHEFYIQEPGKDLYQTGSALFSTLWILQDGSFKAKRIYSYHHLPI